MSIVLQIIGQILELVCQIRRLSHSFLVEMLDLLILLCLSLSFGLILLLFLGKLVLVLVLELLYLNFLLVLCCNCTLLHTRII
jgi:hypothetical protein